MRVEDDLAEVRAQLEGARGRLRDHLSVTQGALDRVLTLEHDLALALGQVGEVKLARSLAPIPSMNSFGLIDLFDWGTGFHLLYNVWTFTVPRPAHLGSPGG